MIASQLRRCPVKPGTTLTGLCHLHSTFRNSSHTSVTSTKNRPKLKVGAVFNQVSSASRPVSPLGRLSTANVARNVLLGSVFSSPTLYKLGISCLSWIANSKSALLNPDKNVLLRSILRPLLYDHFCAGANAVEVRRNVAEMKDMGYAGVILCYGREILIDKNTTLEHFTGSNDTMIDQWRDGNLATLRMIGSNDYIGIKYTGAGPTVTKALAEGKAPPQQLLDAIDSICQQATEQGSRIWIDAEQQVLQATIDEWTINLMRRYNRNGQALISNTIQAYLKDSRNKVAYHLELAQKEGWSLGIKLVRGAYIASEIRDRIHEIKSATDDCYNSIVRDLLTESFPGFDKMRYPDVHLFLAGHNTESIRKASDLISELCLTGKTCDTVRFGQLQGMADDISCELLQRADDAKKADGLSEEEAAMQKQTAPRAYKCMTWGTVQECMQYLVRRAIENQGATERMKTTLPEMKAELKRRLKLFQ